MPGYNPLVTHLMFTKYIGSADAKTRPLCCRWRNDQIVQMKVEAFVYDACVLGASTTRSLPATAPRFVARLS